MRRARRGRGLFVLCSRITSKDHVTDRRGRCFARRRGMPGRSTLTSRPTLHRSRWVFRAIAQLVSSVKVPDVAISSSVRRPRFAGSVRANVLFARLNPHIRGRVQIVAELPVMYTVSRRTRRRRSGHPDLVYRRALQSRRRTSRRPTVLGSLEWVLSDAAFNHALNILVAVESLL
jgi:hypothetical protein